MTVSGADDPGAVVVKAGDLFVRNPSGTALLRVTATGMSRQARTWSPRAPCRPSD